MRVIFIGDPVEIERGEGLSRLSTTVFGVTFPMSAEVDVSHLSQRQQSKLLNNPHFRATGVEAPPAPLVIPVSALPQGMGATSAAAEAEAEKPKVKKAK